MNTSVERSESALHLGPPRQGTGAVEPIHTDSKQLLLCHPNSIPQDTATCIMQDRATSGTLRVSTTPPPTQSSPRLFRANKRRLSIYIYTIKHTCSLRASAEIHRRGTCTHHKILPVFTHGTKIAVDSPRFVDKRAVCAEVDRSIYFWKK